MPEKGGGWGQPTQTPYGNSIVSSDGHFEIGHWWSDQPQLDCFVVQSLSHVQLFVTPWTAALQASLSFTDSWSCPSSCPLGLWCHPTISFSSALFSFCLQSFPASRSWPMSWLFASGGQSLGTSGSASVLPMDIYGWLPLGLTGVISFLSKGLSRVFSSTTVWKHQFFGTQSSLWSTLISVHDYWKDHSFDYMDFCRQNDVFAFLF